MTEDRRCRADHEGGRPAGSGLRSFIYSDYTVALGILVFCAVVFYLTTRIERVPPSLAQGIQPASYPRGVLVFILLFTGLMLFEARRSPLEAPARVPGLAYLTIGAMFASLAIATWFDFFAGLILFVAICIPLWGLRRYGFAVLYAVVLSVVLFVMFSTFLMVRFPQGALTNLLP
jgi:putative tricarboxylic transport membrane protein